MEQQHLSFNELLSLKIIQLFHLIFSSFLQVNYTVSSIENPYNELDSPTVRGPFRRVCLIIDFFFQILLRNIVTHWLKQLVTVKEKLF